MPTDKEFYEGSYALNITAHGRYQRSRLWCHTRSGRLEFFKHDGVSLTLKDRHRPAHRSSESAYHHIKAFVVTETGDYLATCGAANEWLIWRTNDGIVVGRMSGADFYAPRTWGTLFTQGAFMKLALEHAEGGTPLMTLECVTND